jgi:hypothetical protein
MELINISEQPLLNDNALRLAQHQHLPHPLCPPLHRPAANSEAVGAKRKIKTHQSGVGGGNNGGGGGGGSGGGGGGGGGGEWQQCIPKMASDLVDNTRIFGLKLHTALSGC